MPHVGDIKYNVTAFDDGAGAAKALTTGLVASGSGIMPPEDRCNLLRLWVTLSGTAVDGIVLSFTPAKRGSLVTTNFYPLRGLDSSATGIATFGAGQVYLDFPVALTGKTVPFDVPVIPGYAYLVSAMRDGGAADSAALITADFIY